MKTFRRWGVIIFCLTVIIAIILAGIMSALIMAFPDIQAQTPFIPYLLAIAITGALANFVVIVMGWFNMSPIDLLPPQTIEEKLRRQNPNRYSTAKNTDRKYLSEQTKAAEKNKEYDWMYLFAQAWVTLYPKDPDALEDLADAYLQLEMYDKAISTAEMLIERDKLNQQAFSILGEAHFELGNLEEARKNTETSVLFSYETMRQFRLMKLLEVCEAQGDIKICITLLEELIPLLTSVGYHKSQIDGYEEKLKRFKRILDHQQKTDNNILPSSQ